jgi:hypothetical protein
MKIEVEIIEITEDEMTEEQRQASARVAEYIRRGLLDEREV